MFRILFKAFDLSSRKHRNFLIAQGMLVLILFHFLHSSLTSSHRPCPSPHYLKQNLSPDVFIGHLFRIISFYFTETVFKYLNINGTILKLVCHSYHEQLFCHVDLIFLQWPTGINSIAIWSKRGRKCSFLLLSQFSFSDKEKLRILRSPEEVRYSMSWRPEL